MWGNRSFVVLWDKTCLSTVRTIHDEKCAETAWNGRPQHMYVCFTVRRLTGRVSELLFHAETFYCSFQIPSFVPPSPWIRLFIEWAEFNVVVSDEFFQKTNDQIALVQWYWQLELTTTVRKDAVSRQRLDPLSSEVSRNKLHHCQEILNTECLLLTHRQLCLVTVYNDCLQIY